MQVARHLLTGTRRIIRTRLDMASLPLGKARSVLLPGLLQDHLRGRAHASTHLRVVHRDMDAQQQRASMTQSADVTIVLHLIRRAMNPCVR